MPKPIPYSNDVRTEDTDKAPTSFAATLFPDDADPRAIEFNGYCPRCNDQMQVLKELDVVAGTERMFNRQKWLDSLLDPLWTLTSRSPVRPSRTDTFDLECSCGIDHPNRPSDKIGCGARFGVQVTW
jgi:hypothetical protein